VDGRIGPDESLVKSGAGADIGRARLDPPTFRLTIDLGGGRTEVLEPPGDKTQVCFALQLERFVDVLQ